MCLFFSGSALVKREASANAKAFKDFLVVIRRMRVLTWRMKDSLA